MNNNAFITNQYQTGMNRAPTGADLSFWGDQMQGGMTPLSVQQHMQNSPEWQVNSIYSNLLGRAPDDFGLQHYLQQYEGPMGHMGVRRDIIRQPEYQNRLLGGAPTSVWQGEGRQAAAGINAMPGVFSDYGYESMGSDLGRQALFPTNTPGGQMMPSLLEMLIGAFTPAKEEAPTEEEEAPEDNGRPKDIDGNEIPTNWLGLLGHDR